MQINENSALYFIIIHFFFVNNYTIIITILIFRTLINILLGRLFSYLATERTYSTYLVKFKMAQKQLCQINPSTLSWDQKHIHVKYPKVLVLTEQKNCRVLNVNLRWFQRCFCNFLSAHLIWLPFERIALEHDFHNWWWPYKLEDKNDPKDRSLCTQKCTDPKK